MNNKGVHTVKKRYGEDYFIKLGRKGGRAFWLKYMILPVGTSDYGIYTRDTGILIACLGAKRIPICKVNHEIIEEEIVFQVVDHIG